MTDQVRHKTFVSYHGDDHGEVEKFIKTFDQNGDVFIARALGSDQTMDELIDSENDEYVMRRIREDQIKDSTVTLLFVGKNTWNRKFVDWEIAASLHQGPKAGLPNGVLAILSPELSKAILPDRFVDNWETGYANFFTYPKSRTQLAKWIEQAFESRGDKDKRDLIKNGRPKLRRNLSASQTAGRKPVQPSSDGSYAKPKRVAETGAAAATATRSATPRKPYLHQRP